SMLKTQKHEARVDFLLDRGTKLLWSKGYNGTSVNDIVKEAGIPKGSFYFYFNSKEDFAIKALKRYFGQLFQPALEILQDSNEPAIKRLRKYYEFRVQVLKDKFDCKMGCMASNLGNEMSEHNENIRKTVLEIQSRVKEYIVEVAQEAQHDGDIDPSVNVPDMIAFIEDAGKGAMVSMKEMRSAYPVDNYLNMIRKLIFK
ncbi:MAG: TetR/AcrR family transcriptional regulator, partial [Bacteroidota bacterium]